MKAVGDVVAGSGEGPNGVICRDGNNNEGAWNKSRSANEGRKRGRKVVESELDSVT
jgi:hypothetical protein